MPQTAGATGEVSIFSPTGVPLYPLKTLLPVGAVLLFLQGVAEVCRCIRCIRDGQWPRRLNDVEELENQIVEQYQKGELAEGAR